MAFKRVFSERLETEGDWEKRELNFERERDDLDFLGDIFWVGSRGVRYLSIIDRVALPKGRSE